MAENIQGVQITPNQLLDKIYASNKKLKSLYELALNMKAKYGGRQMLTLNESQSKLFNETKKK